MPLKLLSIVIPARDEDECLRPTLETFSEGLRERSIPHEIIVVDDGSTDGTWALLQEMAEEIPELRPQKNPGPHGFGRAVIYGFDRMEGDACAVVMADASDDVSDLGRYWELLNEGYECVFGSRFIKGGKVVDYPWLKLRVNRMANWFIKVIFRIRLNDTTNAFKAYRRTVVEGCRPLIAPHFNLTVELPLKAIVRGYRWTVIPITWRNRQGGKPKLKMKEMGSRYFFICMYVWFEKYFSRGDYQRSSGEADEG